MSSYSSQNNVKDDLDEQRSEFKQRVNARLEEDAKNDPNPASLSANPKKKVDVDRPNVDPPLKNVSMNKFLNYLVGGLLLLVVFYIWRVTVWAHNAGGYWNLMTGRRPTAEESLAKFAKTAVSSQSSVSSAASSAASSSTRASSAKTTTTKTKVRKAGSNNPHHEDVPDKKDVETMVWELAQALGVKPADLSNAIRPLIDPTVDDAQAAVRAAKSEEPAATTAEKDNNNPGFIDIVEAFIE